MNDDTTNKRITFFQTTSAVMYPSLSAMKMTLLSSNREAKTCSSLLTLRHCSRLSKSTCSRRESTGRHRVSSYTHTHRERSYYNFGMVVQQVALMKLMILSLNYCLWSFTQMCLHGFLWFPPIVKGGFVTLHCL